MQARVDAVTAAVAGAPRTSVFFELDPGLFTVGPGTFVADVIDRAGGDNIAADAAEMWPQLSAEAVVSANPDVILLVDEVAGVTPEQVAARPGWQGIAAVEQDRVVPIDPDLVARPGPRVVDGLEAVAAALHPDRFPEAARDHRRDPVAPPPAAGGQPAGAARCPSSSRRHASASPRCWPSRRQGADPARAVAELLLARAGLATPDATANAASILFQIRLPRIVLAGLVGAALAVAGATYQGVFRNPLADPYLLGVASGAGLGAVLAFILPFPRHLHAVGAVQAFAFLGGIVAVVAVYLLARVGGSVPTTTLILAGVAISAAATAATAYLMYVRGDQLLVIYSWLLGGFNVAGWQEVRLVTPVVLLSAAAMIAGGRTMNTLQFGEEQAASLGVPVERATAAHRRRDAGDRGSRLRRGLIGFVGLVVPHATRLLFGPDYRRLVPTSALLGAAFLIAADAAPAPRPAPAMSPSA